MVKNYWWSSPILGKGVPAVDIIDDFLNNYKAWHTTHDDIDQISLETLNIVGNTLETFITNTYGPNGSSISFQSFTFQTPLSTFIILVALYSKGVLTKRKKEPLIKHGLWRNSNSNKNLIMQNKIKIQLINYYAKLSVV